ncbi:Uncharacterized damage-inducible protein DinB (forms a four-helix bundle) [Paenibacillus uliginis N3/975]|uniref:Uncharacterized damage-inducible protein DinB (Forms a four-helix bundle) n=1 Tax=Paenibacillus uliginis N3/975 TaxID=1313296 RepID=A0A1X7H6H2_9BACL|nr:DinB family protein [Paenibacillus uliginis]SMF79988.1 Uncharacterized damage-inducible protein DinB (forms a four-helix bundle) [Paenibacillus uliginis N3/975]
MKQYVLQQFDYHVWANKKVCAYLQELSEEIYRQKMMSVFPTIYDVMVHIYVVDSNWLTFFTAGDVMEMSEEYIEQVKAETDRLVAETEGKRIEQLGVMMETLGERFRAFIEQHEDIESMYSSGGFKARYVDFIQHIVNHGSYHRGNITAMLRQLGHPGTPTDYGFYLYTLDQ